MREAMRCVLLAVVLIFSVAATAGVRRRLRLRRADTLVVAPPREVNPVQRMSMSVYPVHIEVKGRTVRVESDNEQILPIYTSTGAFFMAMRLQKGVNFLGGLPRGRYLINNRPVTIN